MICRGLCTSPYGKLLILCEDGFVTGIRLARQNEEPTVACSLCNLAAAQLQEYFQGSRANFDFPFRPKGTPFQTEVWNALLQIPYGQTRTYGQIAAAIGKPRAARAVGMACNRNPIWIVIPCHRVVGANRSLTGYAGGLDMKQQLLNMEKQNTEPTG